MNRRQFLRTVALTTTAASVPAVAALDDGPRADRRGTEPSTPTETPTETDAGTDTSGSTATPTGTPTPTPTEAVATPTSGWEPTGRVVIEGATETVVAPDGRTAFVAVGEGFATVDVTDPADPTVIRRVTDISPPDTDRVMAQIQDVKYDDGELLVVGPANYHPDAVRGLARYDVTDPAAPAMLGAYETTFPVHNCYYEDGYAYLTGNDTLRNPLVVVDVTEGTEVSRWSVLDHDEEWGALSPGLRTLHDVYVHDGLAYLAYWDAGTWILDVSDPANPTYVGHVGDHSIEDLKKKTGLEINRERLEPPGNVHYVATDPDGSLLAVGKETWNSNAGLDATTPGPDDPGGPSGIDLYDVADPSAPTHLATIEPPPTADPNIAGVWTTAHNFDLDERYLYSSWYQGGLKIHDLADPADPEEVRYFRRSSEASFWTAQVGIPGETVVATSRFDPPDVPAALYTFPDVPRETPTATGTASPTGTDRVSTDTPTPSPSPASPASPTDGSPSPTDGSPPTTDRSPTTTDTATDGTVGRTDGDGPGLGPLAALAGLGVGVWRLLGSEFNDGDEEA